MWITRWVFLEQAFPGRLPPIVGGVPMIPLPRLALATSSSGPEPAVASLAMLAGLARRKSKVQHFRSWARPTASKLVGQVTGLPGRHLDAWLMPPEICRDVFVRGCRNAELAIVEGTLEDYPATPEPIPFDRPGPLGPVAEALDLPKVAVVDCRGARSVHMPWVPPEADAILLDGIEHVDCFESSRTMVSLMLKRPVIGAIEALPEIRTALAAHPSDRPVPEEIIAPLAASFLKFADLDAIRNLAESRPFPSTVDESSSPREGRRFRVAYAMDEVFGGYFPDTLETLEALGAELVEFSPLRDGGLPEAVDLVMIGCGYSDRYAERLAANQCLITALRMHVCHGGRIYSEGGGTAYLGRTLILGNRQVPGAGILPFDAELRSDPQGPTPVRRTLCRDGWLGPRGTVVRGYRSGRWRIHPAPEPGDCPARSGVLTEQRDIYFRRNAIGSLIHLHLGALPEVVAAFASRVRPHVAPGGHHL